MNLKNKIFSFLLICFSFFPSFASAAISYDNSTFAADDGTSVTTSLSVDGCDDSVLYVWASNYKSGGVASGPTAVSYNGVSLTQFSSENSFLSGQIKENVWYLLAPDPGIHNLIATAPTSVDEIDVIAVSYCGVEQVLPTNNDVFFGTVSNHEFNLTVSTGSWLATVGRNRIDTMSVYGSGANTLRIETSALAWGDSSTALLAGSRSIGLGTTGSSEFGAWAWEIPAASVDGGGDGGSIATSTATTTTETQLLATISFGLMIIIVLISLFTVGFFYNSVNSKKPWL